MRARCIISFVRLYTYLYFGFREMRDNNISKNGKQIETMDPLTVVSETLRFIYWTNRIAYLHAIVIIVHC